MKPKQFEKQLAETGESAIVMDLSDLEKEAGLIVSQAQARAAHILAEADAAAKRESIRLREQARQEGLKQGREEGLAAGKKQGYEETLVAAKGQIEELVMRWSKTLDLFHEHMPAHIADAKTDLVKLALAVAERVTHAEAMRNRAVAPAVVEEALRTLAAARQVMVRVNPVEMEALERFVPALKAKLASIGEIQLVADEGVGAGGAVLKFGAGEIDARMETQIARISTELLGKSREGNGKPG